ncbi:hypothetical protein K8R78_07390 [bacterium]|nr:hypothetical protein [bacterium]
MDDLRDRISDDSSSFESKLTRLIPGYAGYKELKTRREADRLLREHLVQRLRAIEPQIRGLIIRLTNKGKLELLGAVDSLENRLETVYDTLRYDDYGYSGKTDAVKVGLEALDRLYEYDESLIDQLTALEQEGQKLMTLDGSDPEATKEQLVDFDKVLREFAAAARDRTRLLSGVEI